MGNIHMLGKNIPTYYTQLVLKYPLNADVRFQTNTFAA